MSLQCTISIKVLLTDTNLESPVVVIKFRPSACKLLNQRRWISLQAEESYK